MPHTHHDMLAAGAAHHLTYRQLDHWTRTGHLHTVSGKLVGSGRTVTPPAARDLIAAIVEALTGEAPAVT